MKKKKPKPDPLAKVSAPNLRRMVKRRDADNDALRDVLQASMDAQTRLRTKLNEIQADRDRLAFSLSSLENMISTHPAPDEPLPDPAPATVVVNVPPPEEGYWAARTINDPGEQWKCRWTAAAGSWDAPPGWAVDVWKLELPAMPGMTLEAPWARLGVTRWRSWWTWLRHDGALTAPAVADSPWPGVMYRNDIDAGGATPLGGTVFRVPDDAGDPMVMARPCHNPKWELLSFYPLPPATWRQA